MWLSVNESDYAAVEVLDHTSISINGAIDQSYPNQASADVTNVREAAWNGVSEAEKKSVIGDWKTAEVAEADVKELEVSTLRGEETPQVEHLYKATFPTKDDGLLGPITVFVNGDTNEVLGYGLRF